MLFSPAPFETAFKLMVRQLALRLSPAELKALVWELNDELDRLHEEAERAEREFRESILQEEELAGNRVMLDKKLGADIS